MAAEPAAAVRGVRLVAIEGIDGAGKTTLAAGLGRALTLREITAAAHREPSDGPAGALLRRLSASDDHSPMTLALLSAADRHDQQAWLTRLESDVVISDRYYLSGLAYHAADGVDALLYQQFNRGVRRPDLYLFLDLDPGAALARRHGRVADRWERAQLAARLPQAYEAALGLVRATEDARVARLDAAQPEQDVLDQALSAVMPLITLAEGASRG